MSKAENQAFNTGFLVGGVAVLVVLVVLAVCILPSWKEQYFRGTCSYLDGKVHGDVCVKDGEVIYKKSQVDKNE